MRGGNARLELSGRNPKLSGAPIMPIPILQNPHIRLSPPPEAARPPRIQPTDRGKRYNNGLEKPANRDDIEHPIEDETTESGSPQPQEPPASPPKTPSG